MPMARACRTEGCFLTMASCMGEVSEVSEVGEVGEVGEVEG